MDATPPIDWEQCRQDLTMLARQHVHVALQAKVDLSGVVQHTLWKRTKMPNGEDWGRRVASHGCGAHWRGT